MGRWTRPWKKLRWSLTQRGVAGSLRHAIGRFGAAKHEATPHPFDLAHGVDTSGVIGGGDLAAGHAHDAFATGYAGIPPSRFHGSIRRWLATIPAAMAESYSFVDLGCGKGRAVMLASALHFREVVGVELSAELATIAEVNLTLWRKAGKALRPTHIVLGDATEFTLPPGPCLVYLANPFAAPVMRSLLVKLAKRDGPLDIVYQNPEQEAVFTEFPQFDRLWSEPIPMSPEDAAVDPVYGAGDRCNAYRLSRRSPPMA